MDKSSQENNGMRKDDRALKNETVQVVAKRQEETAQIDDLIGSFGKYQFLIFMFKILIG